MKVKIVLNFNIFLKNKNYYKTPIELEPLELDWRLDWALNKSNSNNPSKIGSNSYSMYLSRIRQPQAQLGSAKLKYNLDCKDPNPLMFIRTWE
jgi:hypothetical protein